MTARITRTTGQGRHKKTKSELETIAAGSFSGLTIGTHDVALVLNRTGERLLKNDRGKLSITATAIYESGSKTKSVSATVLLVAKPSGGKAAE